jgi:hypothetical protein
MPKDKEGDTFFAVCHTDCPFFSQVSRLASLCIWGKMQEEEERISSRCEDKKAQGSKTLFKLEVKIIKYERVYLKLIIKRGHFTVNVKYLLIRNIR